MTNVKNPELCWVIDTEGIISKSVICVRKVIIIPNAAGDKADFMTWDENGTPVLTGDGITGTITDTDTLTSTAGFETDDISPGDVIKITGGTGSALNWNTFLIDTNANDNTIVVHNDPLMTNEATKLYNYEAWTPVIAFTILSPGTEAVAHEIDFGEKGRWFPNLAMDNLTTSAVVHLYIR